MPASPGRRGESASIGARAGTHATFEAEGALWLRSSAYGDDKDRVLVKSDGTYTYAASDIAYHQNKRERGLLNSRGPERAPMK